MEMCCVINTNMRTNTRLLNEEYGKHYAKRFIGKRSCYIRFHLSSTELNRRNVIVGDFPYREEVAVKLARQFRNSISRLYYGNAARYSKRFADLTAALHNGRYFEDAQGGNHFHECGGWHLHIVAEVPENICLLKVKSHAEGFVIRNSPLTVPHKDQDGITRLLYFAQTRDDVAAQIYNSRFGTESVVVL